MFGAGVGEGDYGSSMSKNSFLGACDPRYQLQEASLRGMQVKYLACLPW